MEGSLSAHTGKQSQVGLSFVLTFLVCALVATWIFWLPATFISTESTVRILHYIGGAMPALVTFLWVIIRYDSSQRADYWHRLVQIRRIKGIWYVLILALPPFVTLLTEGASALLGGASGNVGSAGNLLEILWLAIILFFFGPLPEELAWRGVGQYELNKRMNPIGGGLVLGVFWMIWHLPLFWMQGSYQQALGIGTLSFWLFFAALVPQAVIMAAAFSFNEASTLSAVLFHWSVNLTGELWDVSNTGEVVMVILWWLVAIILFLWFFKCGHTRKPKSCG